MFIYCDLWGTSLFPNYKDTLILATLRYIDFRSTKDDVIPYHHTLPWDFLGSLT